MPVLQHILLDENLKFFRVMTKYTDYSGINLHGSKDCKLSSMNL